VLPGKPAYITVTLKEGMPSVQEALSRLGSALRRARLEKMTLVKFVHGYGSRGEGGDIRIAVQNELMQRLQRHELQAVIFGEDWRISHEASWTLLKKWPALKQDNDLGRKNRGVTIVVL
jgi:hypothetical protein